MTALADFFATLSWHQPLWLLALAVPTALILWSYQCRSSTRNRLTRQIDPTLLDKLIVGKRRGIDNSYWLLGLLWLLASVAAAGPYLTQTTAETSSLPGANVTLIVDISPSMSVADIPPNRIEQAMLQLADFIRQLDNTRLALVTFSANAYPILPLTTDKETVIHFVDALSPSLVTVAGSNLSRALVLAREALNDPPPGGHAAPPGIAILVSDGGIHDAGAWAEAAKLRQQGHQLFTIGVGTEEGGPVPLTLGQFVRQNGEILTAPRQREQLISLAQAGGGSYYDLSPTGWEALIQSITRLEQNLYEETPLHQQEGRLYSWLILALVLTLLFYSWRRPEVVITLLILPSLLLVVPHAEASPWLEAQAQQALEAGDHARAEQLYLQMDNFQGHFGTGVTAYRQQRWSDAAKAFRQAITLSANNIEKASAFYNRANSLVQLNQLDAAIEGFQNSLLHNPDHTKAKRNLALVRGYKQLLGGQKSDDSQSNLPGSGRQLEQKHSGMDHSLARTESGPTEEPNDSDQKQLTQSVQRWSQMTEIDGDIPPHLIQQLHNMRDDSTLMLRRRFSIEDERAIGLVEEKPW